MYYLRDYDQFNSVVILINENLDIEERVNALMMIRFLIKPSNIKLTEKFEYLMNGIIKLLNDKNLTINHRRDIAGTLFYILDTGVGHPEFN